MTSKRMAAYSVVVALLLAACFSSVQAESCLHNLPEFAGGDVPRLEDEVQAIIPDYRFNCHNKVVEWGAHVKPGGSLHVYYVQFQVWRPSEAVEGCYTLIGYNNYQGSPRNGKIQFIVPEDLQVAVQPGDVVGFYAQHLNGTGGVQLNREMADVIVWYKSGGYSSTNPGVCMLSAGDGRELQSSQIARPVITASLATTKTAHQPTQNSMVAPTTTTAKKMYATTTFITSTTSASSVTSVTTHDEDNDDDDDGNSSGNSTILGFMGGILCGVLIAAITVAVVVCIWRLRRKGRVTFTENPNRKPDITTTKVHFDGNEAYSLSQSMALTENEAYITTTSISTSTNRAYGQVHLPTLAVSYEEPLPTRPTSYIYMKPASQHNGLHCSPSYEKPVWPGSDIQHSSDYDYPLIV